MNSHTVTTLLSGRARRRVITVIALLAVVLVFGGALFGARGVSAAAPAESDHIPAVARRQVELVGVVSAVGAGTVTIDGKTVTIANAELLGQIVVGARVKVEALVAADGSLQAREVRVLVAVASAPSATPDDSANGAVDDNQSADTASANANDDHGQDSANHDAGDDHGVDTAGAKANDDHGQDSANHDAGDDRGADTANANGSGGHDDSGSGHHGGHDGGSHH